MSHSHKIVFLEPTWRGQTHAQINASMINIIRGSFPKIPAKLLAEEEHISVVEKYLNPLQPILKEEIKISNVFYGKTGLFLWRRMFREGVNLVTAISSRPKEKVHLVLLSANSTALAIAKLLAKFWPKKLIVQAVMHGNLNEINGWQTKHPIKRQFGMARVLSRTLPKNMRLILSEEGIYRSLVEKFPHLAASCDVIPHPLCMQEMQTPSLDVHPATPLPRPIRFGLVGQATQAKGFPTFIEVAKQIAVTHPLRAEFCLAGMFTPQEDPSLVRLLSRDTNPNGLSRDEFTRMMASLHYVILPLGESYYKFSPSGALVDAMTFGKPIIATKTPTTEDLFNRFPGIGYLCNDGDHILSVTKEILDNFSWGVYLKQVSAVLEARKERTQKSLSRKYAQLILKRFPDFVATR